MVEARGLDPAEPTSSARRQARIRTGTQRTARAMIAAKSSRSRVFSGSPLAIAMSADDDVDVISLSTAHTSTLANAGKKQSRQRLAEQALDLGVEERHAGGADPQGISGEVEAAVDQPGLELRIAVATVV